MIKNVFNFEQVLILPKQPCFFFFSRAVTVRERERERKKKRELSLRPQVSFDGVGAARMLFCVCN